MKRMQILLWKQLDLIILSMIFQEMQDKFNFLLDKSDLLVKMVLELKTRPILHLYAP